jgi:hypothetical protein
VNEQDYDETLPIMTTEGTIPPDVQRRDAAARADVSVIPPTRPVEEMYDYSVVTEVYREFQAAGWQPQR